MFYSTSRILMGVILLSEVHLVVSGGILLVIRGPCTQGMVLASSGKRTGILSNSPQCAESSYMGSLQPKCSEYSGREASV